MEDTDIANIVNRSDNLPPAASAVVFITAYAD
jgi:hypothetical protein